jgi:hypothetical protein
MALFDFSKLANVGYPPGVIAQANGAIDRLRSRVVDEIDHSCIIPYILLRSSVQMFFQGHIRRALMFIEGGHDAYWAGRGLVTYACARAIYETVACVIDFCDGLSDRLAKGDFEKTVVFVNERQFAARMKDFVDKRLVEKEVSDNTAVNVLTQIDRVAKHIPRFREDYDHLSEKTHPNGLGALHYFWESGDDVVKFSNGVDQDHVIRSLIAAGCFLDLMEYRMKDMEAELAKLPPW